MDRIKEFLKKLLTDTLKLPMWIAVIIVDVITKVIEKLF